jgi:surface antigen
MGTWKNPRGDYLYVPHINNDSWYIDRRKRSGNVTSTAPYRATSTAEGDGNKTGWSILVIAETQNSR